MGTLPLFEGVYTFLVTPLDVETQDVDEGALRRHIDDLIENGGVHGITVLGSTGEFAVLTEEERQQVAEIAVNHTRGRVPVVIGTSALATRTAVRLSRHAERIGADGIIVNPQSYWTPTEPELLEHYRAVGRSVSIPIMVYNNPGTTKVDLSPTLIARLSDEFAHMTAVKESSGDIRRVQDIIALTNGRMKVSIGHQSLALAAFATGAVGWTTGLANTIPRHAVEIFELAVQQGDYRAAREKFMAILPLANFFAAKSLVRAAKAAAAMLGKPLGVPRLPLRRLEGVEAEELRGLLVELGLIDS